MDRELVEIDGRRFAVRRVPGPRGPSLEVYLERGLAARLGPWTLDAHLAALDRHTCLEGQAPRLAAGALAAGRPIVCEGASVTPTSGTNTPPGTTTHPIALVPPAARHAGIVFVVRDAAKDPAPAPEGDASGTTKNTAAPFVFAK